MAGVFQRNKTLSTLIMLAAYTLSALQSHQIQGHVQAHIVIPYTYQEEVVTVNLIFMHLLTAHN